MVICMHNERPQSCGKDWSKDSHNGDKDKCPSARPSRESIVSPSSDPLAGFLFQTDQINQSKQRT
jgi:hypothetical protein